MSNGSVAECKRNCHRVAAEEKKAIAAARNAKTVEITRLWREGYAAVKAENDRLQRERDETYRSDMAEVGAVLLDCLEGCQP